MVEKKIDDYAIQGSNPKFRIFLSSDPSKSIPIGLIERCIKLTNEPPTGLKANLKRAYLNFSEAIWEQSSKQSEFKAIVFGNHNHVSGAFFYRKM